MTLTREQYLEINEKGFEGDLFLKLEFEKVIQRNEIEAVIETGTFHGNTTKQLSKMVRFVHSIEVNPENFAIASNNCKHIDNVGIYLGSSEKMLQDIFKKVNLENKFLFFLDAHWEDYNPLRDELKVIKESGLRPCIIIHDFKVPNKPFGFDTYKGQDYELSWIKDLLIDIYGPDFKYYYNEQAEGANRGVIFINC